MSILKQDFYNQDVKQVARELLGKSLVSTLMGKKCAGIIVETEAYLPERDSACHGFRGVTQRNRVMFGPAGTIYVYAIHSRHCLNVVTAPEGQPAAVLIRAVEPIAGVDVMARRRRIASNSKFDKRKLCTGPGRLCEALGVDREINGSKITTRQSLWIEDRQQVAKNSIVKITTRIGVTSSQHRKLRYVLQGNPFASGPRRLR
jgi:DNA-3-methyladenine glycosylase